MKSAPASSRRPASVAASSSPPQPAPVSPRKFPNSSSMAASLEPARSSSSNRAGYRRACSPGGSLNRAAAKSATKSVIKSGSTTSLHHAPASGTSPKASSSGKCSPIRNYPSSAPSFSTNSTNAISTATSRWPAQSKFRKPSDPTSSSSSCPRRWTSLAWRNISTRVSSSNPKGAPSRSTSNISPAPSATCRSGTLPPRNLTGASRATR